MSLYFQVRGRCSGLGVCRPHICRPASSRPGCAAVAREASFPTRRASVRIHSHNVTSHHRRLPRRLKSRLWRLSAEGSICMGWDSPPGCFLRACAALAGSNGEVRGTRLRGSEGQKPPRRRVLDGFPVAGSLGCEEHGRGVGCSLACIHAGQWVES